MPKVMYAKTTGTRVSGYSTLGDTSDANCYATPKLALAQVGSDWTSDDSIIVVDGTFSLNNMETNTAAALSGVTINIVGSSNDPTLCTVQSTSATLPLFNMNKSGSAYALAVSGMTLKKTVAHTSSSVGVFMHCPRSEALDLSFTDCRILDTTFTLSVVSVYAFFNVASNGVRTLTFTRVTFEGLSSASLGGICFAAALVAGCKVVFIDCDFNTITHDNTAESGFAGGFSQLLGVEIYNCRVNGIDIDSKATTSLACYPFFYLEQPTIIAGLVMQNLTIAGGACGPAGVHIKNTYDIDDLTIEDFSSTPAADVNTTGGSLLINGESAQGTLNNFIARRGISNHGAGIYFTQGGGGTVEDWRVEDCESRINALVSISGWGNVTMRRGKILTGRTGELTDPTDAGLGGAIYMHNHPTQSTHVAVREIEDLLILGVTNEQPDGYNVLYIRNANETYAHNVTLNNIYADCPGNVRLVAFSENERCALNISGSGNIINGGQENVFEDFNGTGTRDIDNFDDIKFSRRGVVIGSSITRTVL